MKNKTKSVTRTCSVPISDLIGISYSYSNICSIITTVIDKANKNVHVCGKGSFFCKLRLLCAIYMYVYISTRHRQSPIATKNGAVKLDKGVR